MFYPSRIKHVLSIQTVDLLPSRGVSELKPMEDGISTVFSGVQPKTHYPMHACDESIM